MAKLPMPFSNPRSYAGHSGVDFPQSRGTAIRASGPGKVLRLPHTAKGGYWTTIRYDNGATIGYAHQDKPVTVVKVGQRVAEGTVIGYVGSTGTNSTGPHLHIENVNQATEAGIWLVFDRSRVVNSKPSTSGGTSSSGWPARERYGEAWVKAIQDKLNRLGYRLTVDGKDGPGTQAAVRDFQSKNGLPIDGIAGPNTNAKLDAVLAGSSGGKLTVDGQMGPATIKALQSVLGVTVDGKMGPATIKALQTRLVAAGHNIAVDGQMGPATVKALQTFVLGAQYADGKIGPQTISGLQNYLNNGGKFVVTTPPPTTTPEKITVDGKWGAATTRALQKKLGVTVDGQMGPNTWKALQTATGQTADGTPGPKTYKALQMNVGATVDGTLGPKTVTKLQEFLNAGSNFKAVVVPADTPTVTYPKPAAPTYPDAGWWDHSPNSSPRREGDKVQYFVIHHAASTATVSSLRDRFMNANDRKVSPNWLIGADGSVSEIVPPDNFRAWTSGAFDYNAVTVETQNTSGDPSWGISQASHEAIAKLVAWASKRYGFPIDRTHVIGHREVPGSATICPGPSMNLDRIVELAKSYAAGETPVDPTPETPKDEWTITLPKDEAVALAGLLDKLRELLP